MKISYFVYKTICGMSVLFSRKYSAYFVKGVNYDYKRLTTLAMGVAGMLIKFSKITYAVANTKTSRNGFCSIHRIANSLSKGCLV